MWPTFVEILRAEAYTGWGPAFYPLDQWNLWFPEGVQASMGA